MTRQISFFDGNKPYKINKPIRLIELFGGYGSQHFALEYLGANFQQWKLCEWAVKSIQAYKDAHFKDDNTDYSKDLSKEELIEYLANKGISANYNEPMTKEQVKRLGEDKLRTIYNNIMATHNLVNIQQVKGEDLEIVDTDKYTYIMTYSFPCFTADSLVLTRNGYKRIADICIDDEVLSHDNKYHKVVNRFENGIHDIYKINAMGIDEIKTTYNHKFYVREKYRKGHKAIRCFKEPVWKELKDLTNNDYLGIAINQENRSIISNKLPTQDENFWWIIGRYLGDGWIRQQGGIIICCAKDETYEIISKLENLNWNYNIVNERTVNKIHISKKALSDFVEQFGKGAGNKHLTQDILDLPIFYLKPFIEGYLSADGCFTNGTYKSTSISRELIYGMAQCIAKVYKTPYRIYKVVPPKTKIIEDRIVNQNVWYQLVYKTETKKQDKAFYEDGYIWYPIKSIEYIGKDYVYDIEVEDSHSFTVQNTIVHNCQDLSKAGLGKGMEKGSGTRSGLLWEVERVLDELNEMGKDKLPKVLLMENVPDVIGTTAIKDFAKWLAKLESLGYKCYWNILNAKNLGIPQNRERCFMVSILGDYFYSFPKIIPLTYKLVDVLEKNVDEKFYLSDKMLEYCTDMKNRNGFVRGEAFKPIDAESQNYARTITTMSGQRPTDNFIKVKDGKYPIIKDCENYIEWHQKGLLDMETRAWKDDKISPTIHTNSGKIKILENQNLKSKLCNQLVASGQVQEGDVIRHSYSSSRMNNFYPSNRENKDCSPTLDTRCDCLGIVTKQDVIGTYQYANSDNFMRGRKRFRENKEISDTLQTQPKEGVVYAEYRIRKLTPKECFRLMGIKDEDFEKVAKNQSNASLYHLAGDSIVVAVLVAIFGQMLDNFDFNEYIEEFYKEIEYINKEYDEDECLIFRYDLKQKLEEMKEV
jgi:DNA-cytosine methyltransferase